MTKARRRDPIADTLQLFPEDVVDEAVSQKDGDPLDRLRSLYRMETVIDSLKKLRDIYTVAKEASCQKSATLCSVARRGQHEQWPMFYSGKVSLGLISEISGLNLTGEYLGHTKKSVEDTLSQARGGVCFIDEAYELGKGQFGQEAMTALVAAMTDPAYNGMVAIIAG
ncbi:hypothetical protein HK405_014185 [Cladochytrium tenue]|nr:hypothetical protein HK405_014185 [Cladochytrium tenue]